MAEKEYIEREAVNALIEAECSPKVAAFLNHAIDNIPAADVRPVVLCRDCIHFQQFRSHDGFCKIDGMLWNNDFFCANSKRRGADV